VRGFERVGNLAGDAERFVERHRAFGRLALDILHHQVIRANVVERVDIRMIQRRDQARLALEAFAKARGGNFDRHIAPEPRIVGAIHFAHSALADQREDLVGAESLS
jgi:hypothetical protein